MIYQFLDRVKKCSFIGLQALIEREWIQAGHPFQTRHNKLCYSNIRTKSQQPTFLLFLDCIFQLHNQFPCSFEYTTQFLILLFEHSYFSPFGNQKILLKMLIVIN